jgi:hypothetical protein
VSASTLSSRIARRLGPLAVLVALALPLLTAGPAAADADPASDILLGSQVFYPYQPAVSAALQRQLEQKLSGLKANGMNLKVAIIQSPVDLGALPSIFGKPQQYAEFLDREISFSRPQPLLVVMPNGFGLVHAGPLSSVAGLKIDKAQKSNGLAAAAVQAVDRIAKANGKSTTGGSGASSSSSGGGGGTSPVIIFGIPILVILLAVGAVLVLRRRAAVRASASARSGTRGRASDRGRGARGPRA